MTPFSSLIIIIEEACRDFTRFFSGDMAGVQGHSGELFDFFGGVIFGSW